MWTGHVGEAIKLRQVGIKTKIILFGGYLPDAIPELLAHELIPTVYDRAGVTAITEAARRRPLAVYVKIDAGLGRLGVSLTEAESLIRSLAATPGVYLEGIYTHLPFSDREGQAWAQRASRGFALLLEALRTSGIVPPVTQLWGSSGLLAGLGDPSSAVCVGHLLYGLSPFADAGSPAVARPVCTAIKAALIHVRQERPGGRPATGGYGRAGAAITGVLAVGRSDGMPMLSGDARPEVLVRGRRAPVIGVSLEHTILDLTKVADAEVGDTAVLVGTDGAEEITSGEWATGWNSTPLSLLMGFSGRLAYRLSPSADQPEVVNAS